jgi:predicted helicase
MNTYAINQYHNELDKTIRYAGSANETTIRSAFQTLLNAYAERQGLLVVAECSIKTLFGTSVRPDGTLKDSLRQDWGYWEAKDEADDLDEEIKLKFEKGYPKNNILFEDSQTAVLIQNGEEVMRCKMSNSNDLDFILEKFCTFEHPEVQHFRKAIELFKNDIPEVTKTIRSIIAKAPENKAYAEKADEFLTLCRRSINPEITPEDISEMMIQHILTEDIFNTIFGETQFHEENNIAKELSLLIKTFFVGNVRRDTMERIKHYYDALKAAASRIADHHEKQKFLKTIYESFYRSYNPKAADRLGVFYTPNEIVQFMIKSTDYLLDKHFKKHLEDRGVEILDPCTGTGTFICDMIDHIRSERLQYKYKSEIHANEVAILPYYISNLNIEYTYAQKMGKYEEFANLCFVDTLDNTGFHWHGKQRPLPFSIENELRIKNQNEKDISVIIGNPPYYVGQASENDKNKNRKYKDIDQRIRGSFLKYSKVQKTALYDMYARFYRWAFDRLDDNGIIAFVTNRGFIDKGSFDGFRKTIEKEFEAAYIIDTLSDRRINEDISGSTYNVFGISTGIAIMFLVKKQNRENKLCKIRYFCMDDFWRKEQKLQWFAENHLMKVPFTIIRPDKNNNWINLPGSDPEGSLPIKDMFELICPGISTNRDDWVIDHSSKNLKNKIKFLIEEYNKLKSCNDSSFPDTIKWSADLISHFQDDKMLPRPNNTLILPFVYRPFVKTNYYAECTLSDRLTSKHYYMFGKTLTMPNWVMSFSGKHSSNPFTILCSDKISSYDCLEKTQCIPLFKYDNFDHKTENVTDWALSKFASHYSDAAISKTDIFCYVYAVLHNSSYRKQYELNLKQSSPLIPLYKDFHRWAKWGNQLIKLHTGYEAIKPYQLQIEQIEAKRGSANKPVLKAYPKTGTIQLDKQTRLTGIPPEAWEYMLVKRSALEWVLDQFKEKKSKDPTIEKKFNNYRFAEYKEQVIDLLKKVCAVSIETMRIVQEIENAQH